MWNVGSIKDWRYERDNKRYLSLQYRNADHRFSYGRIKILSVSFKTDDDEKLVQYTKLCYAPVLFSISFCSQLKIESLRPNLFQTNWTVSLKLHTVFILYTTITTHNSYSSSESTNPEEYFKNSGCHPSLVNKSKLSCLVIHLDIFKLFTPFFIKSYLITDYLTDSTNFNHHLSGKSCSQSLLWRNIWLQCMLKG